MSGTFAATPPLECLKMVPSTFMTEPADQCKDVASNVETLEEQQAHKDDDTVILIFDVSRPFFHPEIN